MKSWYATLQPRERTFIWGAVFAVIGTMLYLGMIEPMDEQKALLIARLASQAALLAKLRGMESEVKRLQEQGVGEKVTDGDESLLSILDSTSQKFELKESITRLTPDNEQSARIWLEKAEFDNTLKWLIELARNYGVQVENISFSREGEEGLVQANMKLVR